MSTTSSDPIGTGWRRADGRIGIRNHVVVLSTVALTDRLASLAAEPVENVVVIAPALERGVRERDASLQKRVVDAIVRHPNVGGILLLTHDVPAAERLRERHAAAGKPVTSLALMAQTGFDTAIAASTRHLQELRNSIAHARSSPVRLADLMLALECGGSDATSSVCANPAIGQFVDRVIHAGGSAIVSETAEFIGAEAIIRQRSVDGLTADRIIECLQRTEAMMQGDGEDYRGINPTAENIEAGLTTLVEKTMGAVCKIGTSPISGCLDYGERPDSPGLYFMDTPFFSPVSLTGMMAASCQLTLFGMGVFNPSANPLTPTLKVCGNPQTLQRWGEEIDVDVSGIIDGTLSLAEAGDAVGGAVGKVTRGEITRSEARDEGQIIVPRSVAAL